MTEEPVQKREWRTEKPTAIQIGRPARPEIAGEALEVIQAAVRAAPSVQSAHLPWSFMPDSGDPPHHLLCVVVDPKHDLQATRAQVDTGLRGLRLPPGVFFDMLVLHPDDPKLDAVVAAHCEVFPNMSDVFATPKKRWWKRGPA